MSNSDSSRARRNGQRLAALCSTALVALAPATGFAAADQVESSDYWRVVEVTGEARMLAGANPWNDETELGEGDVVGPYQSIATGGDGSVILARGEDIIVVYENSTIELPPPSPDHAETEIMQRAGSAYYVVDPRPNPHFEVQTPHLVVGVKGTEFELDEDGSQLAVVHGLVNAAERVSGAHADVPGGQGIGAGNGAPFTAAPLNSGAQARLAALSIEIAETRADWADEIADQQQEEADAIADVAEESGNNAGGNSNGAGNSGNSNAGGNSSGNNAGGNSNGAGNSGNSNAGGNGNGNSGGNGNGNSGGNGNGNSGGNGNGNSGGNGNGNSGGNGNGNN